MPPRTPPRTHVHTDHDHDDTYRRKDMKVCLDIIRSFPQRYSYPLTLVYQVGRVGSTSTMHAVKRYYPGAVVHIHALKNNEKPQLCHMLIRLWKMVYPVHIITPIREPLPWSLSFFFQQEKERINRDYSRTISAHDDKSRQKPHRRPNKKYIKNLWTSFLRDHLTPAIEHYDTWFDKNIRRHFHIDALRMPFPQRGYQTYHHRAHRLLVFRSELPDREKESILASFLDIPLCAITARNVSAKGYLKACYQALSLKTHRQKHADGRAKKVAKKSLRKAAKKSHITRHFYSLTETRQHQRRQPRKKHRRSLKRIRTYLQSKKQIAGLRMKIHKTKNPNIALIYQMGKVGSSAILDAMVRSYRGAVFHTHNLSSPPDKTRHIHTYVKQWIQDHPTYTISLVRNPLEQAISWFFDNLRTYSPSGHALLQQQHHDMNAIELSPYLQAFHKHYDAILHRTEHWYQNNIEKYLHIDVYAREFPHHQGYSIYEQGHHKLLLMRSECPDAQKTHMIRAFIEAEDLCVLRSNVTALRPTASLYTRLKRHIVLDKNQVEALRSSRFFRHFYEPDTIEATCAVYGHERPQHARPGRLELPTS
ncbi:MAG: hypothetical protein GDA54_00770 [Alphaproteobacteria bacterium GM7ARS4]|nr:hypothetical protein [Alphaproteobacteria bacterium GM7ARS4]